MSETSDVAGTQALAAAVAAAVSAPGFSQAAYPAAQLQGTAPFPKLQPEAGVSADQAAAAAAAVSAALTGVTTGSLPGVANGPMAGALTGVTGPMTAATAAAISTAMANGTNGGHMLMGTATMTTMAGGGDTVLASLNHSAHDQMLEIMNTYHTTNAHRRRSSVEAAAAASSVLASIANSTKPYMDGDMAAAAAIAAAASPTSMSYSSAQSAHHQQQTAAAAALLAASSMNPGMLPTIPSGAASLRNTPPPQSGDHPRTTSLAEFSASAFSTLSPQAFAATEALSASIAAPAAADISSPPIAAPAEPKRQASGRRRKPAAAPTAPAASQLDMSSDENEDDLLMDEDGLPMTPGAPGSGRPGSLRNLTADQRRARRLQRNRLAAKECRQKKKAYIQNLEDQVSSLQDENSLLRKEIEELNAKLTLSGMRATSSAASTPVLDSKRLIHENNPDSSVDSLSSPSLASKRPRVAVRSTSSSRLQNGDC
ncbi:hypothetical protein IWW50_002966 [Coemansia erecta]|nr:hypothetical protein GGF43_002333 [Coemansia sp. RSA 2618]KAJ2825185.1 hypothetical protein IWW50_002966 [Coemansia erecta]